jgi:hypothetical protein
MLARRETIPEIIEGEGGNQLEHKHRPLGDPAENKNMDQSAGGFGTGETDGPPDADASDGAEHQRDQDKESRQAMEIK